MLVFPILATLVWAFAMRWRRQWPSFAIVTGAVVLLLLLVRLLASWHEHLPPMYQLFYEVLWPYIGLTGGVGYYICCLPRPPAEMQCAKCRYDVSGLNPRGLLCPECGSEWRGKGSEFEPPPVQLTPIPTVPRGNRRIL